MVGRRRIERVLHAWMHPDTHSRIRRMRIDANAADGVRCDKTLAPWIAASETMSAGRKNAAGHWCSSRTRRDR